MPERKFNLPLGKLELPVTEVSITNRQEGVIEYQLEDGAVIRVAIAPTQVMRMDDVWDGDGRPVYLLKHGTVVTTMSAPPNISKKN